MYSVRGAVRSLAGSAEGVGQVTVACSGAFRLSARGQWAFPWIKPQVGVCGLSEIGRHSVQRRSRVLDRRCLEVGLWLRGVVPAVD